MTRATHVAGSIGDLASDSMGTSLTVFHTLIGLGLLFWATAIALVVGRVV
ncbi:hypothetical protein [Nocardioides deserti]|uniref:Uncharacterized protein n=1 Tax=Nocardioides deserti TaxID=1588644 RepID=A0ABR6UCV0_9ACTN|nr:hypothetical protein [Nocardioides deserti]MBC2962279.1 hypothetical protein [Nocardioides deserti]GGO79041.1 hypothetical protein GCM10012276_37870 [Nocardioides deserti]